MLIKNTDFLQNKNKKIITRLHSYMRKYSYITL